MMFIRECQGKASVVSSGDLTLFEMSRFTARRCCCAHVIMPFTEMWLSVCFLSRRWSSIL